MNVRPPRPPIVQPGYGRTIRCESFGNRQQRCAADTRGGVTLVRNLGGNCRQGQSWGYDRQSVFVSRGCRAEFRTGYSNGGGNYPQPDRDRGPSTGVVIAGVAVAGGLLALLASNASKKKAAAAAANAPPPTYPAGPPAALSADLAAIPAAARPVVQNCLFDAARQIGVTGGSRVVFDRAESLESGNGGYRLRTTLVASYPDGERDVPMYCRATPTKIVELSFGG